MSQDKFEVKKIKVLLSRSEETYCYSAVVYWDGKPTVEVGNSGFGGPDDEHVLDKDRYGELVSWIDSLPVERVKLGNSEWDSKPTLENLCGKALDRHVAQKEFAKVTRSWAFFVGEFNQSYRTIPKKHPRGLVDKHVAEEFAGEKVTFLNDLTLDEYIALTNK